MLINRSMVVVLEFEDPLPDRLNEVVESIVQLIDSDPDDLYDQFVSHNELKQLFRLAKAPTAIIELAKNLGGPC